MDEKYTSKSAPNRHLASAALGRCNCFAEHRDLMGCLICIPFYCLACDEWHVEEGEAVDQQPNRRAFAA